MYNMGDLLKALGILLFVIFCFCLPFIIGYFITLLIIWVANGLFNYDLHDKFWYIYVLVVFILPILRSHISVNVNK